MKTRYVYHVIVDGVVRYVGKGTGTRATLHLRKMQSIVRRRAAGETVRATYFHNKLAKAWRNGAVIDTLIIVDGLTDEEAFALEIMEIASFPSGQLWNQTSGGEGFSTQDWKNPERRLKLINAIRLALGTEANRKRATEHVKKLWADPETRAKMSKGISAAFSMPEKQKARSEATCGYWSDPNYRDQITTKLKVWHARPEAKALLAEKTAVSWDNPQVRAARTQGIREAKGKPEARELARQQTKARMRDPKLKQLALQNTRTPAANASRSKTITSIWQHRNAEKDRTILEFIETRGSASPKELKAKFGQVPLSRLVKSGLIERRGGYHDGRYYSTNVHLFSINNRR